MTNNYLIRLFPEEPFFFGGEKSFGNGDGQSYFVKSNYFPQQTGLLGLLRFQLLKQNNMLNQQDPDLIGPDSFSAEKAQQDFGKIKSLSPVFIQEGTDAVVASYLPLSFDYGFNDSLEIESRRLNGSQQGKVKRSNHKTQIPHLEGYNSKNGLAKVLIESKGEKFKNYDFDIKKKKEEHNGVYIHESRVGILKDKAFPGEDDAFYRQEYLNLAKGYSFSFFASIDDKLIDDLVWLGKEKTFFRMVVTQAEETSFEHLFTPQTFSFKNPDRKGQVILTSDAFASNTLLEVCTFSINQTVDFRNIQTPGFVKNYAALNQNDSASHFRFRSNKYELFKRGSIFWGDTASIENQLKNDNFGLIGYNKFITF